MKVVGCLPLLVLGLLAADARAQPPAAVEEAGAVPLTVGADLFARGEARENYDSFGLVAGRISEGDRVAYRARLDLGLPPLAIGHGLSVSVLFQPQATGAWGALSGGLEDPSASMHQAVLRLAGARSWLDVGRFEMIYGEHLVIGNVGWHETGRAFDGVRLRAALGASGAYLDAFVTMLQEGALAGAMDPPLAGDLYFWGLYAGLGPLLAEALDLDVYLLFQSAPETIDGPMPRESSTEATLGARVKKTVGPATLRGEAGVQVGERPGSQEDVSAYHVDVEAMFALPGAIAAGAGALYASGDDPVTADLEGWNQLYPTAHKFLGLMDIIGPRTNISALAMKLRGEPAPRLALGLDAHLFFRPEIAPGAEHYAGWETDIWADFAVGTGLSLRAMYAAFLGNEDGPLASDALAHYGELQLRYQR